MPARKIIILENSHLWSEFLVEAFDDTVSMPETCHSLQEALPLLRQQKLDILFANPTLLTASAVAALQTQRVSNSQSRTFALGKPPENLNYRFDEIFPDSPPDLCTFQKSLAPHLTLPDPLRLLVVDDEPGVIDLFQDYFEHRKDPSFIVQTARNGEEGEAAVLKETPNVLILDIKMPQRDGREVFRSLKSAGRLPPTIVFFDAVSSDEVLEIRRWGKPAFVEKGSRASGMPDMAALIKKLAFFG